MYAKFQFRNNWGCGIINKEWASDGFLFNKYRILYFIIKIILLPFESQHLNQTFLQMRPQLAAYCDLIYLLE